ncbi:DUF7694 domain-containing protein [Sphingomonas sp. 3-13AW]|uniref:DUF7694 domain-containing protein n=1 Tax=Sphingomonas sp. 3-13AW TaxID=3050450 RepID=UPI003BB7D43D
MKPAASELRQLRRDNQRWPAELVAVPVADWPLEPICASRVRVLRSRNFLVQVFVEVGSIVRLSVNRTDWDERQQRFREDISWEDLQRLKREAGYADEWAVEVLPADGEIVNVANMRHIWLLPEAPAFGWRRGV